MRSLHGFMTDLLSLASLALSVPRWAEVALFFWVLDISYSISSIFLRMSPMLRLCYALQRRRTRVTDHFNKHRDFAMGIELSGAGLDRLSWVSSFTVWSLHMGGRITYGIFCLGFVCHAGCLGCFSPAHREEHWLQVHEDMAAGLQLEELASAPPARGTCLRSSASSWPCPRQDCGGSGSGRGSAPGGHVARLLK